jgi:hypothetical protein
MMLNTSGMLGWLAAALLFAAVAAWLKLRRSPPPRRLDGSEATKTDEAENASRLLVIALAVSAAAAVLAIAGSIFG